MFARCCCSSDGVYTREDRFKEMAVLRPLADNCSGEGASALPVGSSADVAACKFKIAYASVALRLVSVVSRYDDKIPDSQSRFTAELHEYGPICLTDPCGDSLGCARALSVADELATGRDAVGSEAPPDASGEVAALEVASVILASRRAFPVIEAALPLEEIDTIDSDMAVCVLAVVGGDEVPN